MSQRDWEHDLGWAAVICWLAFIAIVMEIGRVSQQQAAIARPTVTAIASAPRPAVKQSRAGSRVKASAPAAPVATSQEQQQAADTATGLAMLGMASLFGGLILTPMWRWRRRMRVRYEVQAEAFASTRRRAAATASQDQQYPRLSARF